MKILNSKLFLCFGILLSACSVRNADDEMSKAISKMRGSSGIKQDVHVFPAYSSDAEWTKPINGKEILGLAKKSKEAFFSTYIFSYINYDRETSTVSIANNEPDYLGTVAHTYREKDDNSDISSYMAVYVNDWDTRSRSTYLGSNAFGVTATVLKSESSDYRVVIGNRKVGDKANLFIDEGCLIPSAEWDVNNIRIELLAKLISPYHADGVSFESPTLDSPYSREVQNNYFRANVIAARLVNVKNGNIYKCKIGYKVIKFSS